MPDRERATRLIDKLRKLTADETGYLGMPDGSVQGTAEADGYIYDVPYKPGYTYVRILNGVDTEPADALAGGVPHNPNRRVGFQRFGGVLVAMGVNALSAAAGGDVPGSYIPPHALGDHSDVDATGGSTGDVLTQQPDGTFAFETPDVGAPDDATYITQTANAGLSNEQALSALSTGLVKVTTGTGVLSTAGASDLPAHASRHQSGGADSIKLDDFATPDDNTDLDATTGHHGLLPKLGGGTTNFLRADGTWQAPGGASNHDLFTGFGGSGFSNDADPHSIIADTSLGSMALASGFLVEGQIYELHILGNYGGSGTLANNDFSIIAKANSAEIWAGTPPSVTLPASTESVLEVVIRFVVKAVGTFPTGTIGAHYRVTVNSGGGAADTFMWYFESTLTNNGAVTFDAVGEFDVADADNYWQPVYSYLRLVQPS